jgi:hypothetical protein
MITQADINAISTKRHEVLDTLAGKIRSKTTRDAVQDIIESGRVNAWDTIADNRNRLDEEVSYYDSLQAYWDSMFKGTIVGRLSEHGVPVRILNWFAKYGITR